MATELDQRAGAAADANPGGAGRWRWLLPALGIVAFLAVGGPLGSLGGKLSEVQRNDRAAYLPESAEATAVLADSNRFTGIESTTAIVVYTKPSGVTEADRLEISLVNLRLVGLLSSRLAGPPIGPIVSDDHQAAEIIVPFIGSDPNAIRPDVDFLRQLEVAGLELHVAGPAAAQTDLIEVYGRIDVVLLLVTAAIVLLILIAVYRSPILPFAVLAVAGVALGMAHGTAYLLAKAGVLSISGQVQGILDVLVLGAGTDYALLLVSRFREELRHHRDPYEAMRRAWRAAVEPIAASGGTVILGLLCLLASGLPSTRGLGPVAAIGIAYALLSMLVLLPAILVLLGRVAFWPWRPMVSGAVSTRGAWASVAGWVGARPRVVWVMTALVLGFLAVGTVRLQADGVPRTDSFLIPVDSVAAQQVLGQHYPASLGAPAVVITRADRLPEVIRAASAVAGVVEAEAYVDPLEKFDQLTSGGPEPGPKVLDGLAMVEVTLKAAADSPQAVEVVRNLREAVRAVPGAEARVGGYTANNVDVQDTSQRDRLIIMPLVLGLVLAVLILLLRALVAPLLLVGTVILSYLATLGVCGLVFRDVFGFAGSESSFPLLAFVFLVALGVDYNIFLMTRVREEVALHGHRAGTLTGLAVTGGVITSAGIVLAATFAALFVVPLVYLTELAFAVACGVLLDTLLVRSLLVPALSVDIGRIIWWPSGLRRTGP
jgi:RND superfamily putative drug exporter